MCGVRKGLIKSQVSQVRSAAAVRQHHLVCCKQILVLYWSAFSVLCYYVTLKFVDLFLLPFSFLSLEKCVLPVEKSSDLLNG